MARSAFNRHDGGRDQEADKDLGIQEEWENKRHKWKIEDEEKAQEESVGKDRKVYGMENLKKK